MPKQHGKVVKPYNSVLGEHFRAHWTVKPVTYPSDPTAPPVLHSYLTTPAPSIPPSEAASTKSSKKSASTKSPRFSALATANGKTPSITGSSGSGDLGTALAVDPSDLSLT